MEMDGAVEFVGKTFKKSSVQFSTLYTNLLYTFSIINFSLQLKWIPKHFIRHLIIFDLKILQILLFCVHLKNSKNNITNPSILPIKNLIQNEQKFSTWWNIQETELVISNFLFSTDRCHFKKYY